MRHVIQQGQASCPWHPWTTRPENRLGDASYIIAVGDASYELEHGAGVGVQHVRAVAEQRIANRIVGPLPPVLNKHRRRDVEQFDRLGRSVQNPNGQHAALLQSFQRKSAR